LTLRRSTLSAGQERFSTVTWVLAALGSLGLCWKAFPLVSGGVPPRACLLPRSYRHVVDAAGIWRALALRLAEARKGERFLLLGDGLPSENRTSKLPVPLAIAARASFQKSYSMGQAVMEFEEEGGAGAEEIKELWAWCRKHLAGETEVHHVAAG
jgi:hypothetical protein